MEITLHLFHNEGANCVIAYMVGIAYVCINAKNQMVISILQLEKCVCDDAERGGRPNVFAVQEGFDAASSLLCGLWMDEDGGGTGWARESGGGSFRCEFDYCCILYVSTKYARIL